jgi:hypothetical protein
MRAAADPQVVCGLGQEQVAEEGFGHVRVVVLTGVHDPRLAPVLARQRMVEGRHFHEVRARGGDQVDDFRAQARALPAGALPPDPPD